MNLSRCAAFLAAIVASLGIYPTTGAVIDVDRKADTVTFATSTGIKYAFKGAEDWRLNDLVSAVMWDAGTPEVTDDVILYERYAGISDMLPDAFPHRMEFDSDFRRDFPGTSYNLYGQSELTRDILVSRKNLDTYVVEVTTGMIVDEYANGRTDSGAPYDYISYANVGFEYVVGMRVVTYLVYEIHSDGEDDIIARYDYHING